MGSSDQPGVLLVDDAPGNLVALGAVLDTLDVRLVEARSGEEALQHVEREMFAAALVDAQMPQMDGFETAKRMRLLPNGRSLPILFLTAVHRDEQYVRRAYALGAADYITKPFDPEILRARVRSYAELFRHRDSAHRARIEARTQELDEAQRRLEAFERIACAALETEDLDPFLHTLATVFIEAADLADCVTIMLREGDSLLARASIGVSEEVESGYAVPVGTGFTGRVAATGRPQLLVGDTIGFMVQSPWLRAKGLRALYGAPLVHDREVIGVAYIGSTKAHDFTAPEMRLFQVMADRASWVVSRQRARGWLYSVLKTAPVAISIIRGPDFACEFANDAYRELYPYHFRSGGTSELREESGLLSYCRRVISGGEAFQLEEYPFGTTDSPEAPDRTFSRFSLHPLRDALGRPEAVLAVGVDLTAQVQARRAMAEAQKQAELANRVKDEFLATVSHELRTPLNAILGWANTARREPTSNLDRVLATIERNGRAQARLLEDMLDISRIVAGRLHLEISLVDVSRVLLDAVEAVRPAADGKGTELDVRLGQGLGTTAGDGDRLQQVIWNVLSNAVKFTPAGGRVKISASRDGTGIVVRVSDTGPGIPPDFLPHIFEPFRQGDNSTTRVHGGLGLGLAIAKQLVVAHGGSIEAVNEPAGGATFTVRFPVRLVPALTPWVGSPRPQADAKAQPEARLDGLRVLVIDNEDDSRRLVGRVLESHGATVHLADSGRHALEQMGSFEPDVIVSDIAMPNIDGYTLIRHLRALPADHGGATPAIALTALARPEDRNKALSAGFQEYMTKPVDTYALLTRVKDLVQTRRTASARPSRS